MDPISIAALGSSATNILSTFLQNMFNRQAVNDQNAYNSPASQMQRFKDAGLNPNLIYGQGNAGNQVSPVTLTAPSASAADVVFDTMKLRKLKEENAQLADQVKRQREADILLKAGEQAVKQREATRELTYANTYGANMNALYRSLQGEQLQASRPYFNDLAKYSAQGRLAAVQNFLQRTAESKGRTDILNQERDFYLKPMQSFGAGSQALNSLVRTLMMIFKSK